MILLQFPEALDRRGVRVAPRPITATAIAFVDARVKPVTVVFDFMQPLAAGGCLGNELRQLRSNPGRRWSKQGFAFACHVDSHSREGVMRWSAPGCVSSSLRSDRQTLDNEIAASLGHRAAVSSVAYALR